MSSGADERAEQPLPRVGPRDGEPLVSVIINNYNYERFLRQSIESALSQRYARIEVVAVDDGSTDGSRSVLDEFRHRIIVIEQPNRGHAAALNTGFAAAKGDIILFLDADDVLHPSAVSAVVHAFTPGVAKVHFRLEFIDVDGNKLGYTNPSAHLPLGHGDVVPELLKHGRYVVPVMSGNAYQRDVLERIMPIPEREFAMGADGYLVVAAPFYGRVVAIEETLGGYRVHGRNASAPRANDGERLRFFVDHDLHKFETISRFAAVRGFRPPGDLSRREHVHLRHRLALARCWPELAPPLVSEPILLLMCRGIFRTLRSSLDFRRRLVFCLWFLVVGVGPRQVAQAAVDRLFDPQHPRSLKSGWRSTIQRAWQVRTASTRADNGHPRSS